MKRNSTIGQWLEHILDANLRATSNAHMQIWVLHLNEVLHKAKDRLSWGWDPRHVGTLIECVRDDVNRLLNQNLEHLL